MTVTFGIGVVGLFVFVRVRMNEIAVGVWVRVPNGERVRMPARMRLR